MTNLIRLPATTTMTAQQALDSALVDTEDDHLKDAERGCGMTQCSSCGGFCGRVCQRENLPRYTIGPHKVDYADFQKALELACYYQNLCCDLEEIIEMFCMDAAEVHKGGVPPITRFLITPYYEIDGAIT